MSIGPLTQFQNEIVARLMADSYFADIPIISEREYAESLDDDTTTKTSAIQRVMQSLGPDPIKGTKTGACVIVHNPDGTTIETTAPIPVTQANISISCLENPKTNISTTGTNLSADAIADRVQMDCHLLSIEGVCLAIYPGDPAKESVEHPIAPQCYEVKMSAILLNTDTRQKVAPVMITPRNAKAGINVTLSCQSYGASIYYTLDDTHPSELSTLYTSPISIATAKTLRACAYLSGYVASDIARAEYTN
jgi:hypothetical protein